MPKGENVGVPNKTIRLQELKLELEEKWRIDELLKYIQGYRSKYRDAIWSWNEKQIHFLYLALSERKSSYAARKEISEYYFISEEDARIELSKGLFKAVKDISDAREKDIGGKIYKKNIKWYMVEELFKKLGYHKQNKNVILNDALLSEIDVFLDSKKNVYGDEIILIKELINKNFNNNNNNL